MDQHVIIGAGQAGGNAALAMRSAGFDGRIVVVGDEGVAPYERPPLSKEHLLAADEPAPRFLVKQERYAGAGIEFMLDRPAEAIDAGARRVTLSDGSTLAYDRLLIATGGRARRLAVPGAEHVLYLRTAADARRLRHALASARRVVCIGAGVIGLEIASSASQLGKDVTVVEAGDAIMGRSLAPAEAGFLGELHRQAGVRFLLSETVEAVEAEGRRVRLAGGTILEADLVVAGVGIERNTGLAADAGLAVDNGILVDACGTSSDPAIFAAGDIAAFWHPEAGRRTRLESWQHAQDHGIAVGRAMAGRPDPYAPLPRFWTAQQGVEVQVVGFPVEGVKAVTRGETGQRRFTVLHQSEDDRVVAATIVNNPREIRPLLRLIRGKKPVAASRLQTAPIEELMAI